LRLRLAFRRAFQHAAFRLQVDARFGAASLALVGDALDFDASLGRRGRLHDRLNGQRELPALRRARHQPLHHQALLAGEADKVIDGGGVMHLLALARALAALIAVGDRDGDVHIGQLDAGNLSAQVVRQQARFLAAAQGGNRELVAAPTAHHIVLGVNLAEQQLRHTP
jgi:hypothetical protein